MNQTVRQYRKLHARNARAIAAYDKVQQMAPRPNHRRNPEPDWFTFTRRGENSLLALMCAVVAAVWMMVFAGWLV